MRRHGGKQNELCDIFFHSKSNNALDHTEFCNVSQMTVHRTKHCCTIITMLPVMFHDFTCFWFILPRSKYRPECTASNDIRVNNDLAGTGYNLMKKLSWCMAGGTEDSRCPSWDSNRVLPEIRVCMVTAKPFFSSLYILRVLHVTEANVSSPCAV
jgi:hypothetical protein